MTSIRTEYDEGNLWVIKEAHGKVGFTAGVPIKCGDVIRLEHSNTSKNLVSANFKSYITNSQEVSCAGTNGTGDDNDNWLLDCHNSKESIVKGSTQFMLKHVNTKHFLYVNLKTSLFDENNCKRCPIVGHREVSATTERDRQSLWKFEGVSC